MSETAGESSFPSHMPMIGLEDTAPRPWCNCRPHAVSDKAGEQVQLLVPQRGIWGTASIGGANIDPYCPALWFCKLWGLGSAGSTLGCSCATSIHAALLWLFMAHSCIPARQSCGMWVAAVHTSLTHAGLLVSVAGILSCQACCCSYDFIILSQQGI